MKLLESIASSKLFHNYFDMPIQHVNDDMLKLMKRGFGKEKTLKQLRFMRELPDSFIRTSFIVGHPKESQEMFDEMCEFTKEFGFERINVFSYSDEEGTDAFEMSDHIDDEIIAQRAEILGDIAEKSEIDSLKKMVGSTIDVVVDGESEEHEYLLSAKALMWAPEIDGEIFINDNELDTELEFGKIYRAKITDIAGKKLLGCVIA
jgi:tRNA A37 methylthiotransferase MiaB